MVKIVTLRNHISDRELLEMAAKACGYEYWITEDHDRLLVRGDDKLRRPWNPLTDDGDALRLAVKIGFIEVADTLKFWINQDFHHGDPYAATRRAIVRAAAEIGKEM